jgi:hypothetical protein
MYHGWTCPVVGPVSRYTADNLGVRVASITRVPAIVAMLGLPVCYRDRLGRCRSATIDATALGHVVQTSECPWQSSGGTFADG